MNVISPLSKGHKKRISMASFSLANLMCLLKEVESSADEFSTEISFNNLSN